MAMGNPWLHHLFSFYFFISIIISRYILSSLPKLLRFPIFVTLVDAILSLYFRFCDLSPCTLDLDHRTTMHFWTATHRRFDRPNLVLIHGYGANARWQFLLQVGSLSRSFNLYVPDLLFFGDSRTTGTDRTDSFQARCVCEGLKGLGVGRFSVYAISYGGFVGYRMAEIYPEMVEKVVIVSSGIGCTEDQKREQLNKIAMSAVDLLVPGKPDDLRFLMDLSMYKHNCFKWIPDFFLRQYINVMCNKYRKEKEELVEYLVAKTEDSESELPRLSQETLLIWGEKDNVFPLFMAHQLQRHLEPRSRLEVIKDTGHAANFDSPDTLNHLIKSFVLGADSKTCLNLSTG